MDPLVKCVYLVLTKNGFSIFVGLISFCGLGVEKLHVYINMDWYFGILVLDNCMRILVQYRYFGNLVLDSCVGILSIVLVN